VDDAVRNATSHASPRSVVIRRRGTSYRGSGDSGDVPLSGTRNSLSEEFHVDPFRADWARFVFGTRESRIATVIRFCFIVHVVLDDFLPETRGDDALQSFRLFCWLKCKFTSQAERFILGSTVQVFEETDHSGGKGVWTTICRSDGREVHLKRIGGRFPSGNDRKK